MTRISVGVKPKQLCDQMVLAEHREIVRIPNMVSSGKAVIKNIPDDFRLGSGHVKFFYNKLKFLHNRYLSLRNECIKRGFNITDYEESFINLKNSELYKDWTYVEKDKLLIYERINERLSNMKSIKYYGINKTCEDLWLGRKT